MVYDSLPFRRCFFWSALPFTDTGWTFLKFQSRVVDKAIISTAVVCVCVCVVLKTWSYVYSVLWMKLIGGDSVTKVGSEEGQRTKRKEREGEPECQQPNKQSRGVQDKQVQVMSRLWEFYLNETHLCDHGG